MPALGLPLEHQPRPQAHLADHLLADDDAAAQRAQKLGRIAQLSVAALVALQNSFYFVLINHDRLSAHAGNGRDGARSAKLPMNEYESPVSYAAALAARDKILSDYCGAFTCVKRDTNSIPPRLALFARLHTLQGQT